MPRFSRRLPLLCGAFLLFIWFCSLLVEVGVSYSGERFYLASSISYRGYYFSWSVEAAPSPAVATGFRMILMESALSKMGGVQWSVLGFMRGALDAKSTFEGRVVEYGVVPHWAPVALVILAAWIQRWKSTVRRH